VDVRLDEARQDVAAARLDHPVVAVSDVRADGRDAPVFDRDVALDDVEPVVHRQDRAAAHQ
jgi:hypothetical protein